MIAQVSRKLSSLFVYHEIILAEDREVYEYSFEVLFSTLVGIIAVFIISIFTGTIGYTALFLFGFISLRISAGGYHAKNHFRCFIILMCTYFAFLLLLLFLPQEILLQTIISSVLISVTLVFLIAPAEDSNKPTSESEKAVYKRKSRIVAVSFVAIICTLAFFISDTRVSLSIALGNVTVAISLLASMVKYKVRSRRSNTDICEEVPQNEEA